MSKDDLPVIERCDFCEERYDVQFTSFHTTVGGERICEYCVEPYGFAVCPECGACYEKDAARPGCPECGEPEPVDEDKG